MRPKNHHIAMWFAGLHLQLSRAVNVSVRVCFPESRAVVLGAGSVLDLNILILGSGKVSYSSSS